MATATLRSKLNASKKLAVLAEKELPVLQKNLILQDGDRYLAFGKYSICCRDNEYIVEDAANTYGQFSSTRIALAWCIADKLNDINLACRISSLDRLLIQHRNDIETRVAQANSTKSGIQWEIIISKVGHKRSQYNSVQSELTKCVNRAKYLQIRGFSNETSRTGS